MMNPQVSVKEFYEQHPYFYEGDAVYYPDSDGEPMAETDTHRAIITELIDTLEQFFADREKIYVTGNIMFYYMEDAPNEVISPDVMVCFGVEKNKQRFYQSWKENDVMPSVIFEIASRKTWSRDRNEKRELYGLLGVEEYYIFNPERPKRIPGFLAYRLEKSELKSVNIENNRIRSEVLGLDVVDLDSALRLFNPQTNQFLPTIEELAQENVELKAELARLKELLQK